ncbi:MAG: hypothetical protein HZC01_02670 [Candidatus Kerfeldbacteria bacterium]|nr:hypothetical protein [Candidatus Kerfeldbacteria bacterium]
MEVPRRQHTHFLFWLTISVCVATGFFLFGHVSQAQAVTISQLNLEINADPGETIEQVVQVYDDSKSGVTVFPWVYNFTQDPSREGSALILTDPKDLKPDRAWIQYDQALVALPADGTLVDFPYRIVVPEDAEPGTHLISLVFRTRAPQDAEEEGTEVIIGANVALDIFLKVSGVTIDTIDADFQVGHFANTDPQTSLAERKKTFTPKTFFTKPPVDFLLEVVNQGNTHQKPDGNIKIINDLIGGEPEQYAINQDGKIVLPGTSRLYETPRFGQGFMFGKYRAQLTLLYGNPLKPLNKEVSFWIVPVLEISIALGILLLLIVSVIFYIIWRRKKDREKEQRIREQVRQEMQQQ